MYNVNVYVEVFFEQWQWSLIHFIFRAMPKPYLYNWYAFVPLLQIDIEYTNTKLRTLVTSYIIKLYGI